MIDRISGFVIRKSGSFSTTIARKSDVGLPIHTSTKPRPKFQVKALLGHCLYRRVVIWTLTIFALLTVFLFNPHLTTRSRNVLHIVHGSNGLTQAKPIATENIVFQNQDRVSIDAPKQEVVQEVHEVQLGLKVDIVEDVTIEDTPNDTPNDTSEDSPNNGDTPNNVPNSNPSSAFEDAPKVELMDGIPTDYVIQQEEDASQAEDEDTDGPKWLRYKQ
jgi:hypothetical protein